MELEIKEGYKVQIDEDDYEKVKKFNWYPIFSHGKIYADAFFKKTNKKSKRIRMHRFIMDETDPKIVIDHRDHDGLNNQKNNLRRCSRLQNNHNRKAGNLNSTSKYVGVFRKIIKWKRKKTNEDMVLVKWGAAIMEQGKFIFLGYHLTEETAALAYDKKALELRGEFAAQNIKIQP